MGPVEFYPKEGLPIQYYPYLNQRGYRQPVIFAKFRKFITTHSVLLDLVPVHADSLTVVCGRRRRLDQLGGYSYPVSPLSNTPLENILNPQFLADLLNLYGLALVREC